MTAEIVSVGTELLLGQIVDTHAPVMARILAECGIGCTRRTTIGDNFDRLVNVLRESLERADVVVTIGGLGPTVDDLTRDAIAAALGDELVVDSGVEEKLRAFFAQRSIKWLDSIGRQAQKPTSATLIDNPNGTAPGLFCKKDGKVVIALPGPKGEFDPMARGPVKEILSKLQGSRVIHSRTLRILGMGESMVENEVRDLMDGENPTLAPYAHLGEVHLRITASAPSVEEAIELISPMEMEIRSRLGDAVFAIDSETLEHAIVALLVGRNETLAVAESMTGGELAGRISSVPGASKAFKGGVIAYTMEAKETLLEVDANLLSEFGPVSSQAAIELASNVRIKLRTTYGVAITGNAGPTSDVDGKPVGLTFIAVAGPNGVVCEEGKFRGIREDIRRRGTQTALDLLRRQLIATGPK